MKMPDLKGKASMVSESSGAVDLPSEYPHECRKGICNSRGGSTCLLVGCWAKHDVEWKSTEKSLMQGIACFAGRSLDRPMELV